MPSGATHRGRSVILHATTIAFDGRAALIRGPSGSGKSGLALELLALGATLVADDRTILRRHDDQVIASAPDTLRGQIEARGVGILAASPALPTAVHLIVDLETDETDRLPPERQDHLLGLPVPVIRKSTFAHFPAAILLYLKGTRIA